MQSEIFWRIGWFPYSLQNMLPDSCHKCRNRWMSLLGCKICIKFIQSYRLLIGWITYNNTWILFVTVPKVIAYTLCRINYAAQTSKLDSLFSSRLIWLWLPHDVWEMIQICRLATLRPLTGVGVEVMNTTITTTHQ